MPNPPPDSPELQQFYKEEAERKAKKTGRGSSKRQRIQEEKARGLRSATSEEALQLAQARGFEIETGHGEHGIHVVNTTTGEKFPMPVHGGGQTLSKGLLNGFLEFIGVRPKSQ